MAYLEDGGINGSLFSTVDTGRTLPNGVPERKEYFDGGFQGYGFKIWKDENGKYKIEADDLTIRNSFTIFELIVSQIRAVKGSMAITQGSAKVKSVSIIDANYVIEIEDDINTIVEHDYIRCQKGNKAYHVEVESVNQNYIMVPLSEFDSDTDGIITNPPEAGDEIVQFGNASRLEEYKNRHSAIYLSIDNNEPAIDLMTDIYTKNWDTSLKVRIGGNLPGTDGDRGFYSVNGKIIAVDEEGESIYEINPDGSGFFARRKFSWTASGSPTFSGTILLKVDNDNIWSVNSVGDNIIGNPNGKRIVISPNSSDIKVFDKESNEILSLEGAHYNSNDFFNGGSSTITIKNIPYRCVLFEKGDKQEIVDISEPFLISDAASEIEIEPSIYILSSDKLSEAFSSIQLLLYTYEDEALTITKTITNLFEYKLVADGSITENSKIKSKIPIGYNVIKVKSHVKSANPIPSSVSVSIDHFNSKIILDGYISKLFANGIIMGTSNQNILEFINSVDDKGVSYFSSHFENLANGWWIKQNGLFQIKTNNHWGMPSNIIATGRYSTVNGAKILPQRTFDGLQVTGSKYQDRWELVYPTQWTTLGINTDNCICMVTPSSLEGNVIVNTFNISYDKTVFTTNTTDKPIVFYFELKWI